MTDLNNEISDTGKRAVVELPCWSAGQPSCSPQIVSHTTDVPRPSRLVLEGCGCSLLTTLLAGAAALIDRCA